MLTFMDALLNLLYGSWATIDFNVNGVLFGWVASTPTFFMLDYFRIKEDLYEGIVDLYEGRVSGLLLMAERYPMHYPL